MPTIPVLYPIENLSPNIDPTACQKKTGAGVKWNTLTE
jgi:hypothetical protein